MHRRWAVLAQVGLLLVLAGCAQASLSPPEAPGVAERVKTQTPTSQPEAEAVAVVAEEEIQGNECLDCHRDKQRLIDTAAVEEEAPDESSGVG